MRPTKPWPTRLKSDFDAVVVAVGAAAPRGVGCPRR